MSRRRGPGFVYTAVSFVLMVVIATLAITASTTPPPAIAELAPQAVEQIKDAPPEQSSELGSGEGGLGLGGATTTTTPTTIAKADAPPPPTVVVPRLRRCVGDPPRQTEDPQSPPCVPFWEGTDNGGATTKGVTGDEIRVVYNSMGASERQSAALEAYFNSRFEFYGRRLRLIPFKPAGAFTSCANMLADATKVDEEVGAFASLSYANQNGREACYYDELARRKIISIQGSFLGTPSSNESHLLSYGAYQWNYYPALDTVLANMGEFVCKQLKGRPASMAKAPQNAAPSRRFGLVVDTYSSGVPPPDPSPLLDRTQACGLDVTVVEEEVGPQPPPERGRSPVLKLKDAGVTSVICLCEYVFVGNMMNNATREAYFPEWVVQNFQKQEDDTVGRVYPTEHAGSVFGLRTWNKALPRDQMPYWNAAREADPTYPASLRNVSTDYWNLLLLASGVQLAGPNLTPETFARGLTTAVFPNPGCGGPPFYQACVSFRGDHTMIDDLAVVWYDLGGQSYEVDGAFGNVEYSKNSGAFCYAELGQRYGVGRWPVGPAKIGQGPCH